MSIEQKENTSEYDFFIKNQNPLVLDLCDKNFENYKSKYTEEQREALNRDEKTIVEGISVVNDSLGNRFTNRGGEFPSTLYSHPNIIKALENVSNIAVVEKRISFISGYYTCIGSMIENKFIPSNFLLKVLEKEIPFMIKKGLDLTKTSFNPQKKSIHHTFTEHHFRYIEENGIKKSYTHVHHPITCERMFETIESDSEKMFYSSITQKDIIDAYNKKREAVIEKKNQDFISLQELILFTDSLDQDLRENRFIVDDDQMKYELASPEMINVFLREALKIITPRIRRRKILSLVESELHPNKISIESLKNIFTPQMLKTLNL
ncbi:MAG: hypothetical protein AAF611_02075 [Bacteroidota bacterium]